MQKEEAHNSPSLCPPAQISIIKNRLWDNEAGWHTCSWRSYFKDDPLCARICSLSHYDQQTVKAADYRRALEPSRGGEASFVIELLPPPALTRARCQEVKKVLIEHGWRLVHILSVLLWPWAVEELPYSFVLNFKSHRKLVEEIHL